MIGYSVESSDRRVSWFCEDLTDAHELFDEIVGDDFDGQLNLIDYTTPVGILLRSHGAAPVEFDDIAARAAYDRIMSQS